MFEYLWWLLPSFMKKSLVKSSNLRGILHTVADSLIAIKTSILKSRLSKFFILTDTTTNFYETDYQSFLEEHAKDKNLDNIGLDELLIDPQMRAFLGTKEGMKYYLELLVPNIRVDYIYEISADGMKWIVLKAKDHDSEAMFNRSVLLTTADREREVYTSNRKTRIYSKDDLNLPEFLFWVKVYNRITENGTYTVYPEKIIEKIDRLKPAHTKGHLVFNHIDVGIENIVEGQVFISNEIDLNGSIISNNT
ncbi:MAG: hypothetical protein H8D23_14450 [Candidatus Brocadiales bacterium]|nr:hypothetical protein [Candidatus Brocadiales bacterium]